MHTIAIDCGASFIKGALIENGMITKKMQKGAPAVKSDGDIRNPVQINGLIPLVKDMIEELADSQTKVKLCISNEMHGFLLADENGLPFTDYISWQKEFGSIEIDYATPTQRLNQSSNSQDIRFTGMPLRAGLPSSNLLYLSLKGYMKDTGCNLYFYTLGDYILRSLSKVEPYCHPTNAAATGLFDLRTNNWNYELIKVAGGENINFPTVGTKELVFYMGSLEVHALSALGDQQAALLGSGLEYETMLSFNLGTGAQVSKLTSSIENHGSFQIRPYFNGKYLKTIPHIPSGRALNVYMRFVKDILDKFEVGISDDSIWDTLISSEKEYTGGDLQCDLSFFENAVTSCSTGSISDIGEYGLTMGNLIHAVFVRMSQNFLWAANVIEPDSAKIQQLLFSGGVSRKIEVVRTLIASHYEKNLAIRIAHDETLFGLYKYGLQSLEEEL